jgi:lipopolysaccharide cholinephosphotransferase
VSTIRQLQIEELAVLKEFLRICTLTSLRYYFIGGSLLGAVRHKGFIPWDDDVDVGMPRPDFDRFAAVCSQDLDSRYTWQTYLTEPVFPFMFGKLLRNGTEIYDAATAHLPIQHSVGIDVFPLDGTPDRAVARLAHKSLIKLGLIRVAAGTQRSGPRAALATITRAMPRRWGISLCEALARRSRFEKSRYVVNLGGAYGYSKEAVPREWFGDGDELEFEGLAVCCPEKWDAYLTHIYGAYMTPPPEGKRRSGHGLIGLRLSTDD